MLPRGESIVSPPSHCPRCNAPIKWYQNIPILAWLALRGKCGNCKAPISPRYILVEALGGCLFLAAFVRMIPNFCHQGGLPAVHPGSFMNAWIALLVAWIWISLMIVGSMIDYDHKLLPDFVTVGGMILGVVVGVGDSHAGILVGHDIAGGWWFPAADSVGGLAFGFGLMWLIRWLGTKAFKREAMGLGDVFLMGAVGALFGPVAVLVTLILSSVFGSVVGVSMIALSKTKFGKFVEIPYGPYICMGCLAWMFYGPEIVRWYVRLLGAAG